LSLDVRRWLDANGFGQYADLFEAHQIDADALLVLTEQHLRELGIPVGPRIKLMAALARDAPSSPGWPSMAERRRLTVMFVDLVGSTGLSGRLDPEDLRKVIRSYQNVVSGEAARYGGHLAQYLGDGAMLYFGYPVAHEDDAERAVRAALAIVREVASVSTPAVERLAAHIGIATGLVVVGDLLGSSAAREQAVVGETPNLAARLQGLAGPGEIVLSEATRLLIGNLFELRDLGAQRLRGIAAPVLAYCVGGERAVDSRFEARSASRLATMVGRDRELALLQDRWRAASAGNGQVVLVTGEAGIGKSRVVRALQDLIESEPHAHIRIQCSPYHSDSALFPVIQQITQAAQIASADDVDVRLDRLETLLAGGEREEVALIATLLGIDGTRRYGLQDLSPQQQRLRTFDALMGPLVRLSASQPILWVLEDAHWIDPTTLELVERCIEQAGRLRMLAVITARSEFQHDFGEHPHLTRIELGRLGREQMAEMIRGLTRGKTLPLPLVNEIVAKTDGVPLFVEELTKAMLESGLVHETEDAFVVDAAVRSIAVPATLHDSLMARLDRLQPFKEVAQTAACIGREFGYDLLATACGQPDKVLRESLARLVEAELIFPHAGAPEPRYSFKHALLRDAAYESLLRAKREQIHTRLAAALEQSPDTHPEIIAWHAAQGGLREKAIKFWQKAAAQALARPAYKEAIAHLTQAIRLAEGMGDSRAWQERRLLLWMALGQASIPLYGYSHSQTVATFTRASEVAAAMADAPHRFSILYATWVAHYVRGEQDKALEIAATMLERASSEKNDGHKLAAVRALGISQMVTGTPALASQTFEGARQLSEALHQRSQELRIAVADRFAADPEIATQFHVCLTLWSLGRIDEACALAGPAVAAARAIGHAHTLGHALVHAAIFALACRDVDQALALSAEAIEFASKHDMELWKGYGLILHGFACALHRDIAEAVSFMENGFISMARTQTGAMVPVHRAMYACALAELGRFNEAEANAKAVREHLHSGSERFYWPECQRLLGDYMRLCPGFDRTAMERAYEGAVTLAHTQEARSWELYAAMSLARCWAEQGARDRSVALLAPLLAKFTQGFDSPGYREAQSLLEALQMHQAPAGSSQ
jgi:class 3 adenylate cyclase/predicted ATPase/ABC-type transport system involved in cytochrome c biogenesis ATPase subunit